SRCSSTCTWSTRLSGRSGSASARPSPPGRSPRTDSARPGRRLAQRAPQDEVHEARVRIEADDARRVGHEVRERVRVVEIRLTVALARQVLDAADVELRLPGDTERALDDPGRRREALDVQA